MLNVDDGLSMMTSALLTMLDTPVNGNYDDTIAPAVKGNFILSRNLPEHSNLTRPPDP